MPVRDGTGQEDTCLGIEDLEAARKGDHGAFSRLMDACGDKIYLFSRRMCGNREDAEDILQETFLTAFRKLDGFRGEGTLKSWLFKIASSHCLKKRRLRAGEPKDHLPVEELTPEVLRPIARGPSLTSLAEAPLDTILRTELSEEIDRAIDDLPPEYRMILLLRDVEGFSTRETAELAGLEEGAVKSRLHRARIMVRRVLQPYLEGGRT
jgi:RNA polymerase sigma-70 factor (ECF subfamily)